MPSGRRVLGALSLLYAAQGVPFGFATDYMPVALRQAHYSRTAIAALFWLQLPWNLKILWSRVADRPEVRARSIHVLLVLQTLLYGSIALFAIAPFEKAPMLWFVLTFFAALFASTQDIFVDALAVRSLPHEHLGYGNIAQVAGYRLGMLAGGAGLLLLLDRVGFRPAVLLCGALVLLATPAASLLRDSGAAPADAQPSASFELKKLVRHIFLGEAWPVVVLALTYKLGMHMAVVLIKPMLVDAKWTNNQIGLAAVTLGTTAGLTGAALGGVLHRYVNERAALVVTGVLQGVVCLPLLVSFRLGTPLLWTTASIATESFVSGVGTTVLFAALMRATRKADAGFHYTLLMSANAIAIGLGGLAGGILADKLGTTTSLALAAAVSLMPLGLLARWDRAVVASAS